MFYRRIYAKAYDLVKAASDYAQLPEILVIQGPESGVIEDMEVGAVEDHVDAIGSSAIWKFLACVDYAVTGEDGVESFLGSVSGGVLHVGRYHGPDVLTEGFLNVEIIFAVDRHAESLADVSHAAERYALGQGPADLVYAAGEHEGIEVVGQLARRAESLVERNGSEHGDFAFRSVELYGYFLVASLRRIPKRQQPEGGLHADRVWRRNFIKQTRGRSVQSQDSRFVVSRLSAHT
jgi:hypothetical protein